MLYTPEELTTEQFTISAKSSPSDERTRVLKYGRMFGVFNRFGDIEPGGLGEQGLYFEGTRFLSGFALTLGGRDPMLLSSAVREDNCLFTADLTNVDVGESGNIAIPHGSVHIARSKTLWKDTCYEQIRVANYSLTAVELPVEIRFAADFADVFEVRGTRRERRGTRLRPEVHGDRIALAYRGLDDVVRCTSIWCSPAPSRISDRGVRFDLALEPKQQVVLQLSITCLVQSPPRAEMPDFDRALGAVTQEMKAAAADSGCYAHSGNEQLNEWWRRSAADLRMMIVGNPERDYPDAGVPWFSTPFGRDGIITALECMWWNPRLARGVLRHLADTQAENVDPEADAEPGKVIHEERRGEMAALGEIPFKRYYGSIDSTPLFVMLAGAYYRRTNDLDFIRSIWPNVERALEWMSRYGDRDGDGFLEYARSAPKGLIQQGWKDSHDSVFHADGSLANPPIALCEVQGYAYDAKCGAAMLAGALGHHARAEVLAAEANHLRKKFEEQFWCSDLETYALALDADKKPCRVRTSNAGHCLFSGIAEPDHAYLVACRLVQPESYSGWGIRTVCSSSARYNPVSYHNGSVWPHDNAIVAAGMARYGFKEFAGRILSGLLALSAHVDVHRLPELICGLHRRPGESPTLYPVACSPQAWSAAALFMVLQSCLGFSINAPDRRLTLYRPHLPAALPSLTIRQLSLGSGSVDLFFRREGESVRVEVQDNRSDWEIARP